MPHTLAPSSIAADAAAMKDKLLRCVRGDSEVGRSIGFQGVMDIEKCLLSYMDRLVERPVILLVGSRGTGKTFLLTLLQAYFHSYCGGARDEWVRADSFEDVKSAFERLDARLRSGGEKLLIVIDDLGETPGGEHGKVLSELLRKSVEALENGRVCRLLIGIQAERLSAAIDLILNSFGDYTSKYFRRDAESYLTLMLDRTVSLDNYIIPFERAYMIYLDALWARIVKGRQQPGARCSSIEAAREMLELYTSCGIISDGGRLKGLLEVLRSLGTSISWCCYEAAVDALSEFEELRPFRTREFVVGKMRTRAVEAEVDGRMLADFIQEIVARPPGSPDEFFNTILSAEIPETLRALLLVTLLCNRVFDCSVTPKEHLRVRGWKAAFRSFIKHCTGIENATIYSRRYSVEVDIPVDGDIRTVKLGLANMTERTGPGSYDVIVRPSLLDETSYLKTGVKEIKLSYPLSLLTYILGRTVDVLGVIKDTLLYREACRAVINHIKQVV